MPYVTLGQAAKGFNVSKSTLSKAIKAGKMGVVEKTEDGGYRLDPAEVQRFVDTMRPASVDTKQPLLETPVSEGSEVLTARFEAELRGLKDLLAAERDRREAAERDRDRWHEQARSQTLLLENHAKATEKPRGGLLGWLGGRKAANG
jgi:hypothetical protein